MKRKSPIRHTVSGHTRDGKRVRSYQRGKGQYNQKARVVVGTDPKRTVPGIREPSKHYMEVYMELFPDVEYKNPDILDTIPESVWKLEYLTEKGEKPSSFRYIDPTYDGQPYYYELRKNIAYFISEKGRTFDMVMMSPDQYFEDIARERRRKGRRDASAESERRAINDEKAREYADIMESGVRFTIPNFDRTLGGQEGRHRVRALEMLGVKMVPVLIARDIREDERPPEQYDENWQITPEFREWKKNYRRY